MADKRFVVSKDQMTVDLNITEEKEYVADAAALNGLNRRIATVESTSVTGVKGDNETAYRIGNVSLTPSNIGAIPESALGTAGGVAQLDSGGHIPSSQLPSYVDDIIEGYYNATDHKFYEEDAYATEIPGEDGKIYLSLDTNLPYRWSGSIFVEIPWGLALGETSSTAYRGDRGKTAFEQSNANKTSIATIDTDFAAVESDATASSQAYAMGDYLVLDHALYRVAASILPGGAITEGTNVVKVNLMQELNDNYVAGVKGNAENSYRHGNVNMTLADLGYEVANNLTTTEEGNVLDARQGRAINASILSISGRIDNTQSDIAPVENGATSANAYDTGDYIIRENIFYKVIEDIAVGDAFTVGTNIRATKVVDEMGSGSGGSGGHTILDPSGTALTQRASLQFKRSTLTDDPTNDRTIVSPDGVADFKELNLTQSDLSASSAYARYPYEYTVAWAGATAGSFVKAHITNQNGTEYALPYAAEPFTDYVKLYLANALTAQVHVELYLLSTSEISDTSLLSGYYTKLQTDDIADGLQEQINDKGVLGARNLISYPYYETTKTSNGITFTDNGDGTITVNGTATAVTYFTFCHRTASSLTSSRIKAGGKYILNGCPDGGSSTTYSLGIQDVQNNNTHVIANEYGDGKEINITQASEQYYGIYITIYSGATVSNLLFKPMLRLASDPNDTYQSHAMTNRELTDAVNDMVNDIPTVPFVTPTLTTTTNNANDFECGFIRMNDSNANLPTNGTGVWYDIMTVRQGNDSANAIWGYGFQMAVQTTSNTNHGRTFIRAVNGGSSPIWSEWKQITP